jgi:two-component system cell cycle response regulator
MNSGAIVLIVDDNPINLKLVRVLLSTSGFDVHTAGNAEQALESLKTLRPHLILMDIQLPGMDGLTLARNLKARTEFREVPIVALTAYAMKGDDARAMASGCSGYISKPIDTRNFVSQISRYLPPGPAPSPPPGTIG